MRAAIGLALFALILAANAMGAEPRDHAYRIFRIGTGAPGGSYFSIGDGIARAMTRASREGRCSCPGGRLMVAAQSSSGSVANVEGLRSGTLEGALVQADVAYAAYAGNGLYADSGPTERLRSVARLFSESLHIVSRRSAGIRSLEGLRDRRVALDRRGSGTLMDARALLATKGLGEADLSSVYVAADHAIELLAEGRVDAFFMVAGYPAAKLSRLSRLQSVDLLPVEAGTVQAMASSHPFLAPSLIPAGTYRGVAATPAIAIEAQLLVRADLDEALVHALTRTLWEPATLALLAEQHAVGADMGLDGALSNLSVPLHPGALLYYLDRGMVP